MVSADEMERSDIGVAPALGGVEVGWIAGLISNEAAVTLQFRMRGLGTLRSSNGRGPDDTLKRHICLDSCVRTAVHGASLRTKSPDDPNYYKQLGVPENFRGGRPVSWRKDLFQSFSVRANRH